MTPTASGGRSKMCLKDTLACLNERILQNGGQLMFGPESACLVAPILTSSVPSSPAARKPACSEASPISPRSMGWNGTKVTIFKKYKQNDNPLLEQAITRIKVQN